MNKKTKLPSFIFDSLNKNLTVIWPNGKKELKSTNWQDKWKNPGFDLDPPRTEKNKKGNWVMFGTWKRTQEQNTYKCVRLFYKKVEWKGEEKIITHYMQEQKKQDKLHFILNEADLAYKNSSNKWVRMGTSYNKTNDKAQNGPIEVKRRMKNNHH